MPPDEFPPVMPPDDIDPLACAAYVRCHRCGGRGYPLDAAFLDSGRILVTYAGPCEHYPEAETWLTDWWPRCRYRIGGRPCERMPPRLEADLCVMHEAVACVALTVSGRRCRNFGHDHGGGALCHVHAPARQGRR